LDHNLHARYERLVSCASFGIGFAAIVESTCAGTRSTQITASAGEFFVTG
jgi:hypothetical protein